MPPLWWGNITRNNESIVCPPLDPNPCTCFPALFFSLLAISAIWVLPATFTYVHQVESNIVDTNCFSWYTITSGAWLNPRPSHHQPWGSTSFTWGDDGSHKYQYPSPPFNPSSTSP